MCVTDNDSRAREFTVVNQSKWKCLDPTENLSKTYLQSKSWIRRKCVYLLLVSFLMPPVLLVAQFTLIFWAGHAREEERNNEHHPLLITNWSSYYSQLPAAGIHSIRQVACSEVSTRVLKESLTTMQLCFNHATVFDFERIYDRHNSMLQLACIIISTNWKINFRSQTQVIFLLLQLFSFEGNEVFINSTP